MIIAGTGHRPHKLPHGYGDDSILVEVIMEALIELKATLVITGMAVGFDTSLAKAAIKLGIPYHCYIPFKGQELKWPPASQTMYNNILSVAEKIVYCSQPGYSAQKMQKRNEDMVKVCDTLLALWNSTPGGTANCVRYAIAQQKPYINIMARYAQRMHEAQ